MTDLIRTPLLGTLAVTGLAALSAGVRHGVPGVVGALLGGFVICLTFGTTFWVMERTRQLAPHAVMSMALGAYTVKIFILGLLLVLLWNAAWLNATTFALTVIIGTVVWLGAVVWEASRRRTRIYDERD